MPSKMISKTWMSLVTLVILITTSTLLFYHEDHRTSLRAMMSFISQGDSVAGIQGGQSSHSLAIDSDRIEKLILHLESEVESLSSSYKTPLAHFNHTFSTSFLHHQSSRSLGKSLTKAYFGLQPSFVIGITGGSSTALGNGWPVMLGNYMKNRLNLTSLEVRNAAQGTTSQLVTAPCISQLVGSTVDHQSQEMKDREESAIDLLMWEFAMNDEANQILRPAGSGGGDPVRQRVAEMWMRGALQTKPESIGFLHLWDITMHQWKSEDNWIPDKAWHPTNNVVRQYASHIDAFAVNTMKFLHTEGGKYRDKQVLLADAHHPTAFGFKVAADLLAHSILSSWIEYLGAIDAPSIRSLNDEDSLKSILPRYTPGQQPFDLPSYDLRAKCLLSGLPQFSLDNDISIHCRQNSSEWTSPHSTGLLPETCDGWSSVQAGKAVPSRKDRKVQFIPAQCSNGAPPMEVRVRHTHDWRYLMIDCGLMQDSCKHLQVTLNDEVIKSNVDTSDDIVGAFFRWVHHWDQKSEHTGADTFDRIQICNTQNSTQMDEPVMIQRIVIWHRDD